MTSPRLLAQRGVENVGHVDITFYFGWNLRLHGLQRQCSGVENVGHVDITLYFGWNLRLHGLQRQCSKVGRPPEHVGRALLTRHHRRVMVVDVLCGHMLAI